MRCCCYRRSSAPPPVLGEPISQEDINDTLLKAAVRGDLATMEHLLLHSSDTDAKEDTFGATAMMLASGKGRVDMMKLLLANGSKINTRDDGGWTALMHAVLMEQLEAATFLVEAGIDLDAQNNDGCTALMLAAGRIGSFEIVKLLCEHGANKELRMTKGRNAGLTAAEQCGDRHIVAYLNGD